VWSTAHAMKPKHHDNNTCCLLPGETSSGFAFPDADWFAVTAAKRKRGATWESVTETLVYKYTEQPASVRSHETDFGVTNDISAKPVTSHFNVLLLFISPLVIEH